MTESTRRVMVVAFDLDEAGTLHPAFAPHEMRSEDDARLLAVDLAVRHTGVLAWSALDRKLPRYGDAVELARYGLVPQIQ